MAFSYVRLRAMTTVSHANDHICAEHVADACGSYPVGAHDVQAVVGELMHALSLLYAGCGQRTYATGSRGGALKWASASLHGDALAARWAAQHHLVEAWRTDAVCVP